MISFAPETIALISIISGVLSLGALFGVVIFYRRLSRLLLGASGADLEKTIVEISDTVRLLVNKQQDSEKQATAISERLEGAVQHIGIVRFNPFNDSGGDQSFAIALLDSDQNGVLISSLYARDGVRVYGKPIEGGASPYTLSEEEKRAIALALKN